TGGIEQIEAAALRFHFNGARHTVRGEDHRGAIGNFIELLDESRAQGAQALHHVAVVHHLVTHMDRRAEQLERPLDDVDGAVHAGAETARTGQQYLHILAHWTPPRATLRSRSHCSSASSRIRPAPTEMQLSATLKAGK